MCITDGTSTVDRSFEMTFERFKLRFLVFLFLLAAQALYAISEVMPGDPFAEPYVSTVANGAAVELGWPFAFANCLNEEIDSSKQGPWTRLMHLRVIRISWVAIFLDFFALMITSLSGTFLVIWISGRCGLQFSFRFLFAILSALAVNLMTQNSWLIRHDAGVIAKVEYLTRSLFSYLSWGCIYSVCFVFVSTGRRDGVSHRFD
jgi:hypothetical protein